ncbi:MAG: CoA transferase [Dehalococcoidia bacterium]|nr:CoA transferase [Dehalococcoidia bacterium]
MCSRRLVTTAGWPWRCAATRNGRGSRSSSARTGRGHRNSRRRQAGRPMRTFLADFGAWTAMQDRDELAERLASAGIAAAPVNNEADTLSGEPFASTGYWMPEERDPMGLHLYPDAPRCGGTARG